MTWGGVVRPEINVGKTNRINYRKPALMNIPKDLLWHIIVPRKNGNVLYSVDIKNQEPMIIAYMLNIKILKDILKQEDDLYVGLFKKYYNREPQRAERSEFKTCWNALTYGAGKKSIVEQCKIIDPDIVYQGFKSIPEFKEYNKKCSNMAKLNTCSFAR